MRVSREQSEATVGTREAAAPARRGGFRAGLDSAAAGDKRLAKLSYAAPAVYIKFLVTISGFS